MSDETKKTVLITGAAGGIGCALADCFMRAGFYVVATDILACPQNLSCHSYLPIDLVRYVADEEYASEANTNLRRLLNNRLDTLINNAATQILGGIGNLSRQDWQKTLNVNLLAAFFLAQEFWPDLEKFKGNIVNISSVHAKLTKKDFFAYSTSKAALSGMTRAMAVDLGGHIRVNAIEPAAIETEMLTHGFRGNPGFKDELIRCHPAGCIGVPDDVAKIALWLSSDDCQFIHGASIPIDGGITARLHDPILR
jgi:NAD(P)-dependent dehydrogenase (short-subunit alcohol dehydrogenase family)